MRTLRLLVLALVAPLGAFGVAAALSPPHDGSYATSVTECQSCHKLHGSGGGTLLKDLYSSNNDACLTCHDGATKSPNTFFGTAWSSVGREAVPGTGGDQHKWQGSATARGARIPLNAAMASYLGKGLQCAACHDAHGAKDPATGMTAPYLFAKPDSAHASYKLDVEEKPTVNGPSSPGTGRMKLVSYNFGGPPLAPNGYAVRIKTAGTLEISHNYRSATPTWDLSLPFTVGNTAANDVMLDDPAVLVRFTQAPTVGDTWVFYVSFPLLRASNVGDAMCMDCHADRVQDHACVSGETCTPDGAKLFSHPVNQPLNANGEGYDAPVPLDADGTPQDQPGDNASAKLTLEGGLVRCTTCHAPHNADSNSLTVDVR